MTATKTEKPTNLHKNVVVESYTDPSGVTTSHLGRHKSNPLITQQSVAGIHRALRERYEKGKEGFSLYEKLSSADPRVQERIMCGVASGLTCFSAIAKENGWEINPNRYDATPLLLEISKNHGASSRNPATGEDYKKGWLVFSGYESDVEGWEIYHHALAYGLEQIGERKITTLGVRQFELKDLLQHLKNGVKFIISVDNKIISKKQFKEGEFTLDEGSHLVSVLEIDDSGEWFLIADPYVETYSKAYDDAIPKWMHMRDLDQHLRDKNLRYGIAVASSSVNLEENLADIGYQLAKPDLLE